MRLSHDRYGLDFGENLFTNYGGKGIATEASLTVIEKGISDNLREQVVGMVLPENKASFNSVTKGHGFRYPVKTFICKHVVSHRFGLGHPALSSVNSIRETVQLYFVTCVEHVEKNEYIFAVFIAFVYRSVIHHR